MMRQIMEKRSLLSLFILCVCSVSACQSSSDIQTQQNSLLSEEDYAINATTSTSQNRCGVDGISCNDTALINYTQTEADYREYGERTKRDHLYTQASTGNNLTATIQPDIEEEIVEDVVNTDAVYTTESVSEDDVFSKTTINEVEDTPIEIASNNVPASVSASSTGSSVPDAGSSSKGNPGSSDVAHKVGRVDNIKGPGYEIICEEECDEFETVISDDDVTSEFTEESFNIAELDNSGLDDTSLEDGDKSDDFDIEFNEIGERKDISSESVVKVASSEITDDTILTWDAQQGDTLRELLTKWSAQSGWKLLWNTNRNYTLTAGAMFKGKFTDVSSALIRAFARARPAPVATFYKGNRVIVVETMENENAY